MGPTTPAMSHVQCCVYTVYLDSTTTGATGETLNTNTAWDALLNNRTDRLGSNDMLWLNEFDAANASSDYNYTTVIGYDNIIIDPEQLRRYEKQSRYAALLPSAKATRFGLPKTDNFAELKARQLLKALIGGGRFRRYLKDGFISITSLRTGLGYQIFPGHRSVVIRDKGRKHCTACIVFKDSGLPPTDWVIMRMSLIFADETTFYEKANISGSIPEQIRRAA